MKRPRIINLTNIENVSIRHVAKSAGVALSSVSRVLNNSPHVSDELRRRVTEAVESLGFRPNTHARGLRAAKSMTLGLILRDVGNTTFATLWKAAVDAAAHYGYRVVVITSEMDFAKEDECIKLMLQQNVDGIVGFVADELRSAFRALGRQMPLVLVESNIKGLQCDRVLCDNREGVQKATEYLLDHGHRKIIFLSGSQSRIPGQERRAGFEAAFKRRRIEPDQNLIFLVSHIDDSDRKRLRSLLTKRSGPTALFAATAHLTLESLEVVRELNLSVPEKLSFVGFDNQELARLTVPALTTVERDIHRLGTEAVELLVKRIQDPSAPQATIRIATSLVARSSVAHPLKKSSLE